MCCQRKAAGTIRRAPLSEQLREAIRVLSKEGRWNRESNGREEWRRYDVQEHFTALERPESDQELVTPTIGCVLSYERPLGVSEGTEAGGGQIPPPAGQQHQQPVMSGDHWSLHSLIIS